jgi:hypothetical protein
MLLLVFEFSRIKTDAIILNTVSTPVYLFQYKVTKLAFAQDLLLFKLNFYIIQINYIRRVFKLKFHYSK